MEQERLWRIRKEICRISTMLFEKNLVSGKDGNISVRTGEGEMLITPSGICKAFLEPEMILRQGFDGRVLEGSLKSTKEAGLHANLYERRPEVGAIVHTHPAAATAFAVCGMTLPSDCLVEVPSLLGKVCVAGYAPAGSPSLVEEVEKCGDCNVVFLQNHGVICCGKSLTDAFALMDAVENAAKTILYAKMLGEIRRF